MLTRSSLVLGVLATLGFVACQGLSVESECYETRTCADDAGTTGGDGGNVVTPPGCDLTKSPKDAPSCVDDGVGVFVSPAGSDGAAGTKSAPVKSVGKGVELAGAKGLPRVYVCEGTYDANVEVKSAVSVFGGLSCAWAYTGAKPKVAPAKGVALKVTKVTGAVVLEDLEVVGSADASVPGDSAIAVFISESTDVTLRRLDVSSGRGVDGLAPKQKSPAGNASKGTAGVTPNGGAGAKNTCTDGESTGGVGGTVGSNDATAGLPALGAGQPGAAVTACGAGGTGTSGGSGSKGPDGAAGTVTGVLDATGWAPARGGKGNPGTRGQGGGGGGARAGSGGGGGAGGCGGEGGDGGGGGGASVALLSYRSSVSLAGARLTSSGAGGGGEGALGQIGQPFGGGGAGGTGNPTDGCPGGDGGTGGNGGAGAGGSGGVSAAILYNGTEPVKDTGTTLQAGAAGAAGKGGAGNAGVSGAAANVLEAK